jgi:hypothetical protein
MNKWYKRGYLSLLPTDAITELFTFLRCEKCYGLYNPKTTYVKCRCKRCDAVCFLCNDCFSMWKYIEQKKNRLAEEFLISKQRIYSFHEYHVVKEKPSLRDMLKSFDRITTRTKRNLERYTNNLAGYTISSILDMSEN